VLDKAGTLYEQMIQTAEQEHPNGDWFANAVIQPLFTHLARTPYADNVLGWDESLTENSVLWLLESGAPDAETETYLDTKIAKLAADLQDFTEQNSYTTKWLYMNYVNPEQDPLKS
jgi:hypothetical protein